MNRWRALGFGLLAFALTACGEQQTDVVSKRSVPTSTLPPMKVFSNTATPRGVARSNVDIFGEFLDLAFKLESGQSIARFSRFEGPISVSLVNSPNQVVSHDLDRLIGRLRSEAGIPIQRIPAGKPASITIEMIPKRQLYRVAPNAACIVVPRLSSWAEFRKTRFTRRADWTSLELRERVAVFMPYDISPQDARDCLHEELAQALGPLNDLYRLPDSVYNDDNFHIVLTAYDMMILRAYYAPELRSGMAKHEVAAVLPRILTRVNPAGIGIPPLRLQETPGDWARQIGIALGAKTPAQTRELAATRAIKIAQEAGITDHRLGFSYFARARVTAGHTPQDAAADYARSYALFAQIFGPHDIHTAQAGLQMASLAVSAGHFRNALQFIDNSLVGAKKSQNARLMFSLLAMKAEVYEVAGKRGEAKALRKEAVAWGQYGIYPPSEIKARLELIAKLPPRLPKKGS